MDGQRWYESKERIAVVFRMKNYENWLTTWRVALLTNGGADQIDRNTVNHLFFDALDQQETLMQSDFFSWL
jgi:hypothetical protein